MLQNQDIATAFRTFIIIFHPKKFGKKNQTNSNFTSQRIPLQCRKKLSVFETSGLPYTYTQKHTHYTYKAHSHMHPCVCVHVYTYVVLIFYNKQEEWLNCQRNWLYLDASVSRRRPTTTSDHLRWPPNGPPSYGHR